MKPARLRKLHRAIDRHMEMVAIAPMQAGGYVVNSTPSAAAANVAAYVAASSTLARRDPHGEIQDERTAIRGRGWLPADAARRGRTAAVPRFGGVALRDRSDRSTANEGAIMSLVAFAVRIAAVRVLRAALPSAFVVVDSPVDAIALLEASPSSAVVAVYTGQAQNELDGVGFFAGDPLLNVDLQIFLPQQMAFSYLAADGQTLATVTLDTRGEGSETALDLVERMMTRALAAQADVWSQLFGGFVQKVRAVISSSYLVETSKIKAPSREIRMNCETIQEPVPGAPASDIWTQLLAAMTADTGADSVAALAPWIASEINAPVGLSQAERDRIFLGLSEYAAQAINLTASTVNPLDNPPLPVAEQADTQTIGVSDALDDVEITP
jgi:hypothetical protein